MWEKDPIQLQIENILYPNGTLKQLNRGFKSHNYKDSINDIAFNIQLDQKNHWDRHASSTQNKFIPLCKNILDKKYIIDCGDGYELLKINFKQYIKKCNPQLFEQLNELYFNYFSQQIDDINMNTFKNLFLTEFGTKYVFNNLRDTYKFSYLVIRSVMLYSATITFCPFLSDQHADVLINKCLDVFEKLANYKANERENINKDIAKYLAQLAESVIAYRNDSRAIKCTSKTYDRCCNIILKYIHTLYNDNLVEYFYDNKYLAILRFPKTLGERNKYNSVNYFAKYLKNFKNDTFERLQEQYYNNLLDMINAIQNVQKPIEERESIAEQLFKYTEDHAFFSMYMPDAKRNKICCLILSTLKNWYSDKIKTISLQFANAIILGGIFLSEEESNFIKNATDAKSSPNYFSPGLLWCISNDDVYDLCCLTFIQYSYSHFKDLIESTTYIPRTKHTTTSFNNYFKRPDTQQRIQTYIFSAISKQIAELDKNPNLECELMANIQHYNTTCIEDCFTLSSENKNTLIKQCLDVLNRHDETKQYAIKVAKRISSLNTYSKRYSDEIIKSCENIILNDKLSQQSNAQQELSNETSRQQYMM